VHETLFGEFFMKKAYVMAGSLCVGVLAFSALNSGYFNAVMEKSASQQKINVAAHILEKPKGNTETSGANKGDLDAILSSVKKQAQVSNGAPIEAERKLGVVGQPKAMPIIKRTESAISSNYAADSVAPAAPSMLTGNAIGGMDAALKMPGGSIAESVVMMDDTRRAGYHDEGRDKFQDVKPNPVKVVKEEPVSTFSIDVDTSSYTFMRASLNNNVLPQKNAVRIEEMVNYFPYDYEVPKDKSEPFKANVSVFPTPWNKDTKLVHVGIKGYQLQQQEKPRSNLVFLIDTSGSMNEPNKLPLLINSLKLLVDNLKPDDSIAIVTYAGSAGTVLEPTKVADKSKIFGALDVLNGMSSTAGAEGIRQAYNLAQQHFDKAGVNRVILATDGDFNVGITNQEELKSYIERQRDTGIFLSVLGFGQGNYNDALMQTLAQNGNGNAAYIDSLSEARKVLVEEASSTLFTIAKDVKIQVEFNPAKVAEYRLIGYETRMLNREDFNNDKVDAGDIGAGHTVTALYEITPVGSKAKLVDESRYAQAPQKPASATDEYAFVKIRYKLPDSDTSKLITTPVDAKVEKNELAQVPADAQFAASVAAFAQILRGDSYTKGFSYDDVIALGEGAKGADTFGYRAEFLNLVRLAKSSPALQPLGNNSGGQVLPVPMNPNVLY
jgi:Ca-activated chloride channel family protein